MNSELLEYKLKGYCCSQIIVDKGLKLLKRENPDLVKAFAGLCFGLNRGSDCGILSAATCLLYLADPEQADLCLTRDLWEWFEESFGATNCEELLEGEPLNKIEKCPLMIEATIVKLEEIFNEIEE